MDENVKAGPDPSSALGLSSLICNRYGVAGRFQSSTTGHGVAGLMGT